MLVTNIIKNSSITFSEFTLLISGYCNTFSDDQHVNHKYYDLSKQNTCSIRYEFYHRVHKPTYEVINKVEIYY
jgi:hypothetical protein